MRMFVAVVPPQDVIDDLDRFLEPRREAAAFRWTLPEQWHLTLAFLADVPGRALDELQERLARAGRRRTPFVLRLDGGGAFPSPMRAKVLYAGVTGEPDARTELDRLATGARAAAGKSGIPTDGARFRPHVTLARMSRPVEATRWLRVLSGYTSREFEVTSLALIESHLGEGPGNRPRYVEAVRFGLGRADAET